MIEFFQWGSLIPIGWIGLFVYVAKPDWLKGLVVGFAIACLCFQMTCLGMWLAFK